MDSSLKRRLDTLKHYLANLPDTLPLPEPGLATYNFGLFDVSAEEIDDYGEVGAVNRQLEISFGTRRNGPIVFTERGPELVDVVEVLNTYLLKDPASAILQKWVDDLTVSAEISFATSGISILSLPEPAPEAGSVSNTLHSVDMPQLVSDRPGKGKRHVQKLDSKILDNSHDSDYEDLPEAEDSRKSGAKLLALLLRVSKHCRLKTDQSVDRARCIGSKGCHTTWKWPRYRQRILEHASKCGYIDAQLREAAEGELNKKAIGPAAIVPGTQIVKQQITNVETPTMTPAVGASPVTALVTRPIRSASGKNVLQGFQTEGRKVLQDKGDYAVMKFYVCCGIPPRIADTDEFKDMVSILNSAYHPPSSTTLEDKLIVNEAAKIGHAVRTHLQTCRNLTITFDGGKIRKPTSVYTIHVTTADRRAFCMELDDASLLSHSAEYILEALERVSPRLRRILAFMSRSAYATEHFNHERLKIGITRGLEAIGDTRFGTIYWAGKSVQRSLSAFQVIVENEALGIDIASLNDLFIPGGVRMKFELDLARLLTVIGPYAKAIQCLEGGHVTADRVYYYWLGITSQLDSLFRRNEYGLTTSTIEDIRAITNCRFDEMITDAPNDIYIIAFFLNPEYRNAPIYKKPNPLAIPPLRIRQQDGVTTTSLKLPEDIVKHVGLSLQRILRNEYGDTYENPATKDTAQTVMAHRNPLLTNIHPTDALKSLKEQLKSYGKGLEPFNRRFRSSESLYSWWEQVQKDDFGNVLGALAMKIFAAVPVSMTDERTMSMITWLNSPRRNRQDIETLQDHIKIRQWHRTGPGAKVCRIFYIYAKLMIIQ
ncbi:hypothetical protein PAXINDRAFT_86391 [Paxillus involutus ATCC 200175]|uniref:Uncharacterized protein n=1 Tax=Paxillus involutus ATCC 200175 TaxID=664439 RepID=A0A0C9THI5_PAXIN|nr:hypothetical protein PAXINDRAFT_86391 [Paxillus involutus ATCC 200175]